VDTHRGPPLLLLPATTPPGGRRGRKRDSTDRRTSCARPVMPTCAVCAADEVPWPSSSGEAQAHPYSPMNSFSNMPLQACWLPSPCPSSEYYGASVPFRCRQPAVGLAAAPRWLREEAATSAGSHVHRSPLGGRGVQLYPCGVASGQPQLSPRPRCVPPFGTPVGGRHYPERSTYRSGPYPSALSRFRVKGLPTRVRLLHLPASQAAPGRLMVPTHPYLIRAAPALHCTPRVGLPFASCDRCGGRMVVGLSPHAAIRAAPRGAGISSIGPTLRIPSPSASSLGNPNAEGLRGAGWGQFRRSLHDWGWGQITLSDPYHKETR
jgi:hypothetical protein